MTERSSGTPPDHDLLRRLRARDPSAFDQIVTEYRDTIFRFVLRSVRDRQAAEDITQDAFVKLYKHAPTLQSRERFLPWLYRTARTTLIDHQRRLTRERRIFAENGPLSGRPLSTQPAATLEHQERRTDLRQAISELPEPFRTPFLLRETEGMRYREIAHALELPEKTVSSRISRARGMLAAKLRSRYDGRPSSLDSQPGTDRSGRDDGGERS